MNILLIPLAGYTGSSFVTLICYFTMSASSFILGQRLYKINYSLVKDLIYILVASLFVFAGIRFPTGPFLIIKSLHILFLLIFIFLILLTDRDNLHQLYGRLKNRWK